MKPLTAEEIAELRRAHSGVIAEAWTLADAPVTVCRENATLLVAANKLLPRLLDEVEELRKHLTAVCGPRWREDMEAFTRARPLLKRIEWSGVRMDLLYDAPSASERFVYSAACSSCGGRPAQHAPGCELAALVNPR